MSQVSKDKSIPSKLPVVEPNAEPTFGDRLLESLRPHASLILLSVGALFLLFIAIAWMIQSRLAVTEGEWLYFNRQLSVLSQTGNTSGMKEIAEEYPDGSAGLWALQLAGHYELDQGLRKLGSDRAEGLKDIERAKTTLKKVVDAPADQKTTLLQVRSTYTLAYAYESLGEFENAAALYQQLVDQAPDSAFGSAAQRALARCQNPAFAEVYERFKNWEDPFAVAPGAPTTEKPDISFPELPDSSSIPAADSKGQDSGDGKAEAEGQGEAEKAESESTTPPSENKTPAPSESPTQDSEMDQAAKPAGADKGD